MFNTSNGYSLSDIAAVSGNNRNNGGFGDGDYWWIILLFLFAGNGNWGFGGNGGGQGSTIREEISYGFDMNGLENGVRGIQQGLCDGFYAVNTGMLNGFSGIQSTLCQGFAGVNAAITAGTVATTGGIHDLSTQLAQCCCDNRYALATGLADLNYNLATQSCDTRRAIADSTRDIVASNEAGTRAILDFLTQDKIAALTAENQSLKFAASQATQNAFITANQEAQTAEIIRRLGRDCPVPAYVVPNPNCCYDYTAVRNAGCNNCNCF
jgi:hypothetical protein